MPANRGGTKRRPLVVRPQGGIGAATLNNCPITVAGSWVVFAGFATTSANMIALASGSRYCRVTRCNGVPGGRTWNDHKGLFSRCDHNDLHDKPVGVGPNRIIEVDDAYYTLTDHNYIHHNPDQGGANGHEAWAKGSTGADHNKFTCATFYRNLIDNHLSESEVTSIKAQGALMIGNTADNMNVGGRSWGGRHGPQTWHESEWIEQVGTLGSGNGGQRTLAEHNVIIGSRYNNCRLAINTGDVAHSAYVEGSYPAAYNNLLIGVTTSGTGVIVVGHQIDANKNVPVDQTQIDATPGATLVPAWQTNTTVSATARIPFTPAVKLTTADVGLAAADPLVPAGYS
jgi:hypothetical protein